MKLKTLILLKAFVIFRHLQTIKKGSYRQLIEHVEDRPGHDFRYAIDSTKIQNKLNWKPKESFSSGIEQTIKWYIENEYWWKSIKKIVIEG